MPGFAAYGWRARQRLCYDVWQPDAWLKTLRKRIPSLRSGQALARCWTAARSFPVGSTSTSRCRASSTTSLWRRSPRDRSLREDAETRGRTIAVGETGGKLTDERLGEPSANIRERIERAREIQRRRFGGALGGARGDLLLLCNADIGPAQVREYCKLDDAGKSLLKARHRLGGSALGHAAARHERPRLPLHCGASSWHARLQTWKARRGSRRIIWRRRSNTGHAGKVTLRSQKCVEDGVDAYTDCGTIAIEC